MTAATPASDRELVLTRLIAAAPDKVFQAWTDPALIVQWFTPIPGKPCAPRPMCGLAAPA